MAWTKEYGVRWTEFDKQDRMVVKERFFTSQEAMDRFCAKLEEKPNFNCFEAWLDRTVAR